METVSSSPVATSATCRLACSVDELAAHYAVRRRVFVEDQALFVVGSSPDEFAALLKVERAKWEPVIKAAGIAIKE